MAIHSFSINVSHHRFEVGLSILPAFKWRICQVIAKYKHGLNGTDWMDSVALSRTFLADKHCNTVSCFYWLHLLNWLDSYFVLQTYTCCVMPSIAYYQIMNDK